VAVCKWPSLETLFGELGDPQPKKRLGTSNPKNEVRQKHPLPRVCSDHRRSKYSYHICCDSWETLGTHSLNKQKVCGCQMPRERRKLQGPQPDAWIPQNLARHNTIDINMSVAFGESEIQGV
jgi:hypothetical protein